MIEINKENIKKIVQTNKQSTLLKNENKINKYSSYIQKIQSNIPSIIKIEPYLFFCEDKFWKDVWTTLVHTTSSLPFKEVVGRRIKILVKDKNTDFILGMIHLSSDLSSISLRDKFIGWNSEKKWKGINKLLNIQICVPTSNFSKFLTGKLLVYLCFTNEIVCKYKEKYNENLVGLTTTSLYGKSSMYNRIPFLKYLGLTSGMSALHIPDNLWKNILNDAKIKLGEIKPKNRLNYNKHELFLKLKNFYKKNNIDWPYNISEISQVENKRGVYFGFVSNNGRDVLLNNDFAIYNSNINVQYQFNEWKNRWLLNRINYISNIEKYAI